MTKTSEKAANLQRVRTLVRHCLGASRIIVVHVHLSVKWQAGGGGGVSDMFRAVSGYFLFVHKQHPTVITSSFKYQRAPSGVQPEHWSLVLLETTNFYSMPAWKFFFSPGFFKWSCRIKANTETYGADFLPWPQAPLQWKGAFRGPMSTAPCVSCDIRLVLHSEWHHNTPSLILFYNW